MFIQRMTLFGVLALAVCLAYANSFHAPFLLDDRWAVVENSSIRNPRSVADLLIAPDFSPTRGRPLLNLSFALCHAISGDSVFGYHVFNLSVHFIAGLLLFVVVRTAFATTRLRHLFSCPREFVAALIALLWLLHPLQTASVTYISQRAESMAALFCLLTLYAFQRSLEGASTTRWRAISVVAYACGLASKEIAAAAPLLVLLYDGALVGPTVADGLRRRSRYYAALATATLLLAASLVWAPLQNKSAGFSAGVSALNYAVTEAQVVPRYALLALWPHPLVFDYGREILRPINAGTVTGLAALLAAVAGLLWLLLRRVPALGFSLLAFLLLLAPTSSFIPLAEQPMAENRMYLPLAVVLAAATATLWSVLGRRALTPCIAVALSWLALTALRNHDYRSPLAIWSDTVAKNPGSSRAHNDLAVALSNVPARGPEAIAHYEAALRINPAYAEAHYNLANHFISNPDSWPRAITHYERAISIRPGYLNARNNLAVVLLQSGRIDEARAHWLVALQIDPNFTPARNNLREFGGPSVP